MTQNNMSNPSSNRGGGNAPSSLVQTATVPLVVRGQEYQVTIRPITLERLARYGSRAAPSVFMADGGGPVNPEAGVEFLRILLVAAVVRIDGPGGPYRLGLEADYERRILEPEDLEEPGLTREGEPYKNSMYLLREVANLSGMPSLFRPPSGEGGADGAGAGDGPAPAPTGV